MKNLIIILLLLIGCSENIEDTHNHPIAIKNSHGLWCIEGVENGAEVNYHFWLAFYDDGNRLAIIQLHDRPNCGNEFRNPFYRGDPRYEYEDGTMHIYVMNIKLHFSDKNNFTSDYGLLRKGHRVQL